MLIKIFVGKKCANSAMEVSLPPIGEGEPVTSLPHVLLKRVVNIGS